jgi:uncharacterized protein YceK
MQRTKMMSIAIAVLGATLFVLTSLSTSWATSKIQVLHSFGSGMDALAPYGGLVFDKTGHLYGTTAVGGAGSGCNQGCGTVFELTRGTHGQWTETVLYSFKNDGKDGTLPFRGLILDTAGNLYGVTGSGGTGQCVHGCGTVFELKHGAHGQWTEKVLYSFGSFKGDGEAPAGLIFDTAGNLYGTTGLGGRTSCTFGCGTVFELKRGVHDQWTEKVLYSFGSFKGDGEGPAGLIFDTAGNLYGTTGGGAEHPVPMVAASPSS